MTLHESGCFFYHQNGVYVKKVPPGTKSIRFYTGANKKYVDSIWIRKIFYVDKNMTIEVEWEDSETGEIYLRYFSYDPKTGFVEDKT